MQLPSVQEEDDRARGHSLHITRGHTLARRVADVEYSFGLNAGVTFKSKMLSPRVESGGGKNRALFWQQSNGFMTKTTDDEESILQWRQKV